MRAGRWVAVALVLVLVGCGSIRTREELRTLRTEMSDLRAREEATTAQLATVERSTASLLDQIAAARAIGADTAELEASLVRRDQVVERLRSELTATRSRVDQLRPQIREKTIQDREEKRDGAEEGLGLLQGLAVTLLGLGGLGSGLGGRRS